jgi:hypothetical protein
MNKLIIPVVAGLVIGLAGSTAAVALLGKEPASLTESLDEALHGESADSAGGHGEHGEVPADSAALAHGDSLPADSAHHATIPGEPGSAYGAEAVGHAVEASGSAAPADSGLEEARLAKVFASMPARDAAKVMQHMDDNEVRIILGHLGNREAAAILANLTPERAAAISRAVIRGERIRQ